MSVYFFQANDDDDDFYRKSISKGIINSRTWN